MHILKRRYIQIEMTEYEFTMIQDIVREAHYNAKDGDPIDIPPALIEQIRVSLQQAGDASSIEDGYSDRQREIILNAAQDKTWSEERVQMINDHALKRKQQEEKLYADEEELRKASQSVMDQIAEFAPRLGTIDDEEGAEGK